jgi:hypothetical protein
LEARSTSGFSLVELVVALLFMGLLLSGMVRVYLASLHGWSQVNDGLAAQRALRWSMDRIAEDVQMMGHLFPPPELRALDVAASTDPAVQSGFMLVPGQPGGRTADELSFVMDAPVPVRAVLGEAIPGTGAGAGTLLVRPASNVRLRAGDLLLVAGDRFESARVERPAELAAGRAGPVAVVRDHDDGGAAFESAHPAGALVQVVRPLRVVRYAVVSMALEPGGRTPCLVRFETAYPRDRAMPRWAGMLKRGQASGRGYELVAENVTGFRVDFSPDRRFPGIRGADYAATVRNLEARIRALGGPEGAATQRTDPFWFRNHGGILEVRIETRSPVPVEAQLLARRSVTRSQTLRITPRNFGLG